MNDPRFVYTFEDRFDVRIFDQNNVPIQEPLTLMSEPANDAIGNILNRSVGLLYSCS